MNINLPVKIHNKFEIEVKEITSGKIIQKGFAENIVLSHTFTNHLFVGGNSANQPNASIAFGSGTGVLSAARTTLFNFIDKKEASVFEFVGNQAPLTSYCTRRAVLQPSEYVSEIITEVGASNALSNIFTHALIKDSEGNPLTLGPKTDTQEITIYSTIYFQPDFEEGITLAGTLALSYPNYTHLLNAFLLAGTMAAAGQFTNTETSSDEYRPKLRVNTTNIGIAGFSILSEGSWKTPVIRLTSATLAGQKIKSLKYGSVGGYTSTSRGPANIIDIDLETLAQNNSAIWSGWTFDHTSIGVGDGTTTTFNLNWDEVRLDKAKRVYIDGIEITSGVTWSEGSVTIVPAPSNLGVITGDYSVDYIPKDTDHVVDIEFSITFGEGAPQ